MQPLDQIAKQMLQMSRIIRFREKRTKSQQKKKKIGKLVKQNYTLGHKKKAGIGGDHNHNAWHDDLYCKPVS